MKKRRFLAGLLSAALLCAAAPLPVFAGAGDEETRGSTTDSIDMKSAGKPDGVFSKLDISSSWSEEEPNSLKMRFDFALDDEKFQALFDALEEGDVPAEKIEVGFAFDYILGEGLVLPGEEIKGECIVDKGPNTGLKVADYAITPNDAEGKLQIKCDIDIEKTTSKTGIEAGQDFTLAIDGENIESVIPGLTEKDGTVEVSVEIKKKPTTGGEPGVNYTLEKELVKRSTADPGFVYGITAKAEKDADTTEEDDTVVPSLNGLTIKDTLPENLTLDHVQLGDEELQEKSEEVLNGYTYDDATRVFSYTIPADSDPAVAEAALTLYTIVTPEKYQDYLTNKTSVTVEGNTAELWKEGAEKELGKDTSAGGELSGDFLSKNGTREGDTGGTYDWTIQAQTHFGSATGAYIIDVIPNKNVHMYVESEETVPYTLNGTSKAAEKITNDTAYKDLTAETAATLAEDKSEGVYYTTTAGEAILIVPIEITDAVEITYQTVIAETDQTTPKLENRAKILWTFAKYGPGEFEPPEGDIGKDVDANLSDIQKTGGTYNKETQEMTWDFAINYHGVAMNNVVVTDVLNDGEQTLVLMKHGDTAINEGTGPSPSEPYYVKTNDSGKHETTYKIHLGSIGKGELYKFSLTTKVVDPAVLATQGWSIIKNTASMTYDGIPDGKPLVAEGSKSIHNTLIIKAAPGTYNFVKHTLQWTITANPNSLPIKEAKLTDKLPVGNTFSKIDKIQYEGAEVNAPTIGDDGKITVNGKEIQFKQTSGVENNFSKDTLEFALGDITKPVVITLTTTVDEDYRDVTLRDLKEHEVVSYDAVVHKVVNNCALTGKIVNIADGTKHTDVDATASAEHTITAPPVKKTGVYYKDKNYTGLGTVDCITWTLLVNPDRVNMEGAVLTDNLKDWFELDTASVKIHKATIAADGTAVPGDEVDHTGLTATEKGFQYALPKALARTPLLLTFNTLVTDTASKDEMENTVSLDWAGGGETETPDVGAGGAANFDLGNYASAASAPLLRVQKQSSNKGAGEVILPLPGATFTLTTMEKSVDGTWTKTDKVKTKTVSTRKNLVGTASFLFLKTGTLYLLEETQTPAGYETMPPQYLSFGEVEGAPEGTMVRSDKTPYGAADGDTGPVAIENTPTGSLTFTKCLAEKNEEDTLIAGDPLPNIKFTLKLKDTVIERTATSGPDGIVSFTELDPGTYTMTEDGDTNLSWTVTVTAEAGSDKTTTKITVGDFIQNGEGDIIITNDITKIPHGTITGQKNKTSGTGLAGAVIGLYPSPEEDGALPLYTATSGADGKFTFTLVKPGEYTLREISTPSGYEMNTETVFTVEAAANTVVKKDTSDQDIVIVNKRTPSSGGGGGGSSNGRLIIEKSSDDGAKAGFTFRIKGSGYDKTFVTNSAGKIEIAALAVGTYTVTEMETGATAKYEIPDGQTVKLTGKGATVSFHNKLKPGEPDEPGEPGDPDEPGKPGDPTEPGKPGDPTDPNDPHNPPPTEPGKPGEPGHSIDPNDTPKGGTEGGGNKTLLNPQTSYRSPLPMWIAMALLSAVGFALCAIRLRRRRYRGRHVR